MADSPQTPPETALQAITADITAQAVDDPGYSRVTADKALAIKQLRKIGKTGEEIAAAIGVHPSTVSRWLRLLETDTVQESRQLAKSQALRATMKIDKLVDDSDPRVALGAAKAITALAGVQEGSTQVQVGVQVIVGNTQQPAGPDPFDATTVESKS
jgi:transposase-like protein